MRHSKLIQATLALLVVGGMACPIALAAIVESIGLPESLNDDLAAYVYRLEARRVERPALSDSVNAYLSAHGYLDAQVDLVADRLIVKSGAQAIVRYLVVRSESIDSLRIDAPLTQARLTRETVRLLSELEETGHYFARLNSDSVVRDGNVVDIFMTSVPGPVVSVGRIQAFGLVHSDPSLIERLLGSVTGRRLSAMTINEVEKEASRIAWLNFYPPVELFPRPGYQSVDLKLKFAERRRLTLFGGFGYQSREREGLTWQLSAKLRSLFGGGRSFLIDSERRERGNQELRLHYSQPSFWPTTGEFGFDLSTRNYRDQFSEFAFEGYYNLHLDHETVWGGRVGFKRVEPASLETGHSRYTVGLKLIRSTWVDDFNPSSGYRLFTSLTYAHRRYSDDSLALVPTRLVYNETRVSLSVERVTRLGGHWLLKSLLAYRGLETADRAVPVSELILIGGIGSLRGYSNDRFAARRVGLASFEPRVHFRSGYLFVFYDAAWIGTDRLEADLSEITGEYRHGYGLGLALRGGSNRVSISFGWQPELTVDQPRLNIEVGTDL